MADTVLVTGGSGYVAVQCILALLRKGYKVRSTLRSLDRLGEVRRMLADGGADDPDRVTFVAADLTRDHGWADATSGARYVLHVASPFPARQPRDENDLIVPARDGALRILAAARASGVERVVLTSSFAAVGYGRRRTPLGSPAHPFTEHDWTDPAEPGLSAYVKSKTIAERAAWADVAAHGGPELAVVNPVAVLGPVLAADYSSSIQLLKTLLDGRLPVLVNVSFGIVDVRDVAELHVAAMTAAQAAGQRYLAIAGPAMTLAEVAAVLRGMGDVGRRVPRRVLPDVVVAGAARVVKPLREVSSQLGQDKHASNAKARAELGWAPRPPAEAIIASAQSLQRLGLLRG